MTKEELAVYVLREKYPKYFPREMVVEDWVKDNIVLMTDDDNYALFEWMNKDTVSGHYFFTNTNPKKSVELSRHFIKELFSLAPDINKIVGSTPLEHKAALALTKKLGFTHLYNTDEESVSILTRGTIQQWAS